MGLDLCNPLTSLMTNTKRTTEGLQGEGGRGFYIAQHFLPYSTQSSATFAQADPKEWAQVRSTVRNSCFVKRLLLSHGASSSSAAPASASVSTCHFHAIFPFSRSRTFSAPLRLDLVFTSAHTYTWLWVRGGGLGIVSTVEVTVRYTTL